MAEQLLDQIRLQIRDRVRELEPAAHEYERLDAALTALGGPADARASTPALAPAAQEAAVSTRRPKTPASGRRANSKRAPRGANRAAVLATLAERPGASASELSTASGVARPVLYALLKTLEERGELTKEDLPGGASGYRLASPTAADGPA
jgi:sugar-specific transcriptional regulator TrmB